MTLIDPTAIVHPSAKIGNNVSIGANCVIEKGVTISDFSIIYPNCEIRSETWIAPFCSIGEPTASYYTNSSDNYRQQKTIIGANSLVRSYSIIYSDVEIGEDFQSGHRVNIREKTFLGKHVRIGTLSDIQGYCTIKDYVHLHSNVHIGQKTYIGEFSWIFPYVVMTNDPTPPSDELYGVTIGRFVIIATGAILLPGITINDDGFVGAKTLVRKDVASKTIVAGVPGVEVGPITKLKNRKTGEIAYPWRYHFSRGMPWQGVSYGEWKNKQLEYVGLPE